MKKILFLLLLTTFGLQAQTLQNPTFGNTTTNTLKIKTPATVGTVNFIPAYDTDGQTLSKIAPINVNIPYAPTNYSISGQGIGAHLGGIDTRLGQISNTSAGNTQRIYFTADNTTVNSVVYFASSALGKGTAATGTPSALVLGDNTKAFFTKDVIGIAQPSPTIGYGGTYSGNLTVSATPTPNPNQQRFTVEIYRTNNLGVPIASGVTGAPVGDLGVTVIAILDSGIVNLVAGAISNVSVSGVLTQNITINTGERLRYHVSAAKVGAGGGNVTFGVYYGNAYNSYYDVPVAITTDAVLNKSTVAGATDTDALNNLNSYNVTETTGNFSNIQTLINNNPAGTVINLKPNTIYAQDNSLILKQGNVINGNGSTLKRNVQQITTTTIAATEASTSITVSSVPVGWKTGDYLQLYTNDTFSTSSRKYEVIIQSIAGNVITLSQPIGPPASGSTYTWAIGTTVRKVFSQITSARSYDLFTVPTNWTVKNLIVDGNYTQNSGNFYWAVNMAVQNNGISTIENVTFKDIPNECIFGSGFTVKNSTLTNSNGSFLHQSADVTVGNSIFGGLISGNSTYNTNIKDSNTITGHSEAVITFSFSSGRTVIHGNRFQGGGGSVMGRITYSFTAIDGSLKDFIFSNNECSGYTNIIHSFSYNASGLVANVDNVNISNNIFSNCGTNDYLSYNSDIAGFGRIKIYNNVLSNGTTLTNQPWKLLVNDFISKEFSTQGNTGTPAYDKIAVGGLKDTNESSILFGNSFGSNNGTYLRFRVNSSAGANTPINSLTLNPDYTANFSGRVSGSDGVNLNDFATVNQLGLARPYKVYTAQLNQTGTSAPTATVLENNTGLTVSYTYASVGRYQATFSIPLTDAKTAVFITPENAPNPSFTGASIQSGTIGIYAKNSDNLLANGIITRTTFEVRVYP